MEQLTHERRVPPSSYWWDEEHARYLNSRGSPISLVEVRRTLDHALDRAAVRNLNLAHRLRRGELTAAAWQIEMQESVRSVHLYGMALGVGGWDAVTDADYAKVEKSLKFHQRRLTALGKEIKKKGAVLDGRFSRRVELYAQAARVTYHDFEREKKSSAGFIRERNVAGAADRCAACVAESARGWVEIGKLSLPGTRTCLGNCRCRIEYQKPSDVELVEDAPRRTDGKDRHREAILAKYGDQEVGHVIYSVVKGQVHIDNVLVRPEFRRQGLATKMYERTLARVRRDFPDAKLIASEYQTADGIAFRAAFDATLDDKPIAHFSGRWNPFTNFSKHPVTIDGVTYPTSEHAFQAMKTRIPEERERVRLAKTPGGAKQAGKKVTLDGGIEGWNARRIDVMRDVVRAKIEQNPEVLQTLLASGNRELIEGNVWNDTFWGVCRGKGQNHLGRILMELRDEYRKAGSP